MQGIFRQAAFERVCHAQELAIARVIGGADGVIQIHRFNHDLILAPAVKHDSRAISPRARKLQHARGGVFCEQVSQVRLPVLRANHRSVADDHGQRCFDLAGDGQREIVAPARDQGDFNTSPRSGCDSRAIGLGKLPAAVQKRAINIQRD